MPPAKKKQANLQNAEFQTSLQSIVTRSMERSRDDLLKMNVIEFAHEILKVKLWPTQRAILKALYNLPLEAGYWRDILNTEQLMDYGFEEDERWDEREILNGWVAEGKCTWKEGQHYTELNFECGMRGSKTSVTSIPVSFEFFRMGLYDDPAKQFNLMAGSLIAMLVLATSEEQAQDTLFAAIKGRIENSPYFQSKIASGEIIVNNLEILYPSKNIKLWAGHSRSAGLVGRTLFIFAMDEADRFGIEGTGGASGADMYANVGKGTLTLRPFGSKKIIISSAWAEGDLTDTLHQQAMNGADHILSLQLATWDMNPQFMKLGEMHPDIQQEYATRGVEAMRDYAGIRPGSAETFFSKHAINTCPTQIPLFGFEQYDRKVVFGENANGAEVMDNAFVDGEQRFEMRSAIKLVPYDVRPERLGPYFSFGHGDPGLVGDSFGFVAVHPDFNEEGQLTAVVNTLLQWKPTKKKGTTYPVDFTNVDDITVSLARQIKLGRLSYDHWNSAMLIQRMYQQGVSTSQYKSVFNQVVQREMYTTLREWINMKRVVLPPRDFSDATRQLYRELEELRLINGRKIDHPKPRGSKDLADCLAAAVQKLADNERMFAFSRPDKDGRVEERARVIGGVAAKEAFIECFSEGHAMALRSNPATANMLKNPALPGGTMKRRTVITRKDFYTDHV